MDPMGLGFYLTYVHGNISKEHNDFCTLDICGKQLNLFVLSIS